MKDTIRILIVPMGLPAAGGIRVIAEVIKENLCSD